MDDKKDTTPAPAETTPEPPVEEIEIIAEAKDEESPKASDVPVGKQHKGDAFPAAKSPDQIAQETAAQAEMDKEPECIPIEVFFSLRGINDPGARAARLRYTSLRNAPLEKWDEIFAKAF